MTPINNETKLNDDEIRNSIKRFKNLSFLLNVLSDIKTISCNMKNMKYKKCSSFQPEGSKEMLLHLDYFKRLQKD